MTTTSLDGELSPHFECLAKRRPWSKMYASVMMFACSIKGAKPCELKWNIGKGGLALERKQKL